MVSRSHGWGLRPRSWCAAFGWVALVLLLGGASALASQATPVWAATGAGVTNVPSGSGADPAAMNGPFWVDQAQYGSAGGGFYLDPRAEQVWTAERGWHFFSPRVTIVVVVVWVNCPTYGSRALGFYWDPRSGLVWTAERGWHFFNPSPYPIIRNPAPNPYPNPNPNPYPNPNPTGQLRIWTDRGEGARYRPGERIRICYSVPGPMNIQMVDFPSDGSSHVLLQGYDDGRGGCFDGQVTPPYGWETVSIFTGMTGGLGVTSVVPYPGSPGATRADTHIQVVP